MPVLAMDVRVIVRAAWPSRHAFLNDPAVTGSAIAGKIQAIQDFLNPLSAAFSFPTGMVAPETGTQPNTGA